MNSTQLSPFFPQLPLLSLQNLHCTVPHLMQFSFTDQQPIPPSLSQHFHVRRGALLMKNIFSSNRDRYLSLEEHRFLRLHSSSIKNLRQGVDQLFQNGVNQVLQKSRISSSRVDEPMRDPIEWRPLSDNSFKRCLD